MNSTSTTLLATSVFLTAFAGFGAGYLMSPPPARSGDTAPIIDPDAWNRTAPQTAQLEPAPYSQIQNSATAQTVSDTASSPSGWSAPETDYATALQEDASLVGFSGSYTVEPLDGASSSDRGTSSIIVLDAAEADRAWDSERVTISADTDSDTAPVTH